MNRDPFAQPSKSESIGGLTGQHEELGGVEAARREDDLLPGEDGVLGVAADELDALRPPGEVVEEDLGDEGVLRHVEVAPVPDWPEERLPSAAPRAVPQST